MNKIEITEEEYNVISYIVDRVNEKPEKYLYHCLSDVEKYMLKNIVRDEMADRLLM